MSPRVCLLANAYYYPAGGGHLWAYLNWALGLHALGCEVVWLEAVRSDHVEQESAFAVSLRCRLACYGLAEQLALCNWSGAPLPPGIARGHLDLSAALEADLLLNLGYNGLSAEVIARFRRRALVDIDPGLTQLWIAGGQMDLAPHHVYFTIGEGVGRPGAQIPDCGLEWHYTPPPIALSAWPTRQSEQTSPYTTVTHWGGPEIAMGGRLVPNSKRDGFLPFLDLPQRTQQPLELALHLGQQELGERALLEARGWRVRNAHTLAATPWDYQAYIARSRGEFSCAKPVFVQLATGWVSDRTLGYLASGKPAIVQDTGESAFLPRDAGLFRFRGLEEAVRQLEASAADYARQCALARALAETYFDAHQVVGRVLEMSLS